MSLRWNVRWKSNGLDTSLLTKECTKINFSTCEEKFQKHCLDFLYVQSFSQCSLLVPQFSQARAVSQKGQKFSAYGLKLAQPFLKHNIPALKNWEKK